MLISDWSSELCSADLARGFELHLTYRESPDSPDQTYDLKVNHPLSIGDTDVFLIGHGYAPVITIRDGNGAEVYRGPTISRPTAQTFQEIGRAQGRDRVCQYTSIVGGDGS